MLTIVTKGLIISCLFLFITNRSVRENLLGLFGQADRQKEDSCEAKSTQPCVERELRFRRPHRQNPRNFFHFDGHRFRPTSAKRGYRPSDHRLPYSGHVAETLD